MADDPQEVTAEQLVEAIRQMKVSDLLVSTIATVGQLGYAKLDPDARDLDQVRLAIEALKAIVPTLEGSVEEQSIRDYNQLVANCSSRMQTPFPSSQGLMSALPGKRRRTQRSRRARAELGRRSSEPHAPPRN